MQDFFVGIFDGLSMSQSGAMPKSLVMEQWDVRSQCGFRSAGGCRISLLEFSMTAGLAGPPKQVERYTPA